MSGLRSIREQIVSSLETEERKREQAIILSRALIRDMRSAISSMVESEEPFPSGRLLEMSKPVLDLLEDRGFKDQGILEDPLTELSEAMILSSVLSGSDLPAPKEAGIPERAYILGLCDTIGEMRRLVLNRLLKDDVKGAVAMFDRMKLLSTLMEGMSYPSGMIPLKKKQDVVRALMDRTAGELAVAKYTARYGAE